MKLILHAYDPDGERRSRALASVEKLRAEHAAKYELEAQVTDAFEARARTNRLRYNRNNLRRK